MARVVSIATGWLALWGCNAVLGIDERPRKPNEVGGGGDGITSASLTSAGGAGPASGGTGGVGGIVSGGAAGSGGPPLPSKYVFLSMVTPVPGVDFIGVAQADTICTNDGATILGGTYVAWLSDATLDAIDRIGDARYILPNGAEVFASKSAIPLGPQVVINRHANNVVVTSGQPLAWTGTMPTGLGSGYHCNGWTSNSANVLGTAGVASLLAPNWTQYGNFACDRNAPIHLYCFQQ